MGACASSPAAAGEPRSDVFSAEGADRSAPLPSMPSMLLQRGRSGATDGSKSTRSDGRVGSLTLTRLSSAPMAGFLSEVQALQAQLSMIHANPLIGLQEAAELLSIRLKTPLVAIWALTKEDPGCSVLMAVQGPGSTVLQRRIVVRHPPGSPPSVGGPCSLSIPDAAGVAVDGVPVELVTGEEPMRSFVQIVIGPPEDPRGVLLLAKPESASFGSNWWQVRLQLAAAGLLPHMRSPHVEQIAQVLTTMEDVQDPVALISLLLRSAGRYMKAATNMRASARLSLMTSLSGPEGQEMLVFEAPAGGSSAATATSTGSNSVSSVQRLSMPSDADADVVASRMTLANTLIASAIKGQQARFITDCSAYMQACGRPARDVFTRSSQLVSSLCVVPLIAGDEPPLGGLYFTFNVPCDFLHIQDTLLGFIHGVTPMLHNRLTGRADLLASMVSKARARGASVCGAASGELPSDGAPGMTRQGSVAATGASLAASSSLSSSLESGPGQLPAAGSGRLSMVSGSQRLNTEAMLQVLQQDLRSKGQRSLASAAELVVSECLGQGGFGTVFKGWWHKVPVAAKVMPARSTEYEALQVATEMAVLSTVHHPNVVSVFSCLTDMVEAGDTDTGRSVGASITDVRVRYRRLAPNEDPEGTLATYNIVVMEFCDKGTLYSAMRGGNFHRQLEGGVIGVDLAAIVAVLLDTAYAVQYLHAMQLMHGDIKMENVLLKTDHERPLGFTPKLADFGLTRILNDADHTVNLTGAGTVTHLAPEMFTPGSKVTKAVDAYAFGVLMFELYTKKRAYAGLPRAAVIERVHKLGMRPRLPSTTPPAFARLAEACWSQAPTQRPTFAQITEALEGLATALAEASVGAAAGAPPAALPATVVGVPSG